MRQSKIIFFLLFSLVLMNGCSSHKWVALNHRDIASDDKMEEALLKTDWGHIKVHLGEEKNDSVAVHLEIYNQSRKDLLYKRDYITFMNENNFEYKDQQVFWGLILETKESEWRVIENTFIPTRPVKLKYSSLSKVNIDEETLLIDTVYISKEAFLKSKKLRLVFSRELVPDKERNVIDYQLK